MFSNLSTKDVQEIMRVRQESDKNKDMNKVDTERLRRETFLILQQRKHWEASGLIPREAFEQELAKQFPYVEKSSPMLYKLALEDEPLQVITGLNLILGNIEKARQEHLRAEQCSLNVDKDLSALYVKPSG